MNAIGAYIIVKNQEAARGQQSWSPAGDGQDEDRAPRPSLRKRIRKLFGRRPRVASEPGFAATHVMLSDFIPPLRAYPYPPTYR